MPSIASIASLTAASITGDRIDLSWTGVPGASVYHICRAGAPRGTPPLAVTDKVCFSERELQPNTNYRYVVAAMGSDGRELARGKTACTTLKAGLFVTTDGLRLTVHGDAFEITWDGDAGGDIVEIRQYDGHAWFRINAAMPATVPGLVLTDEAGKAWPVNGQRGVRFRMEKETPEHVQFALSATAAGIRIGMRYSIYREGVLFSELSMPESELTDNRTQGVDSDANKALLDRISGRLALHLNPGILDRKFAWGYIPRQSGAAQVWKNRTDKILDSQQLLPLAMADYGQNAGGGFTNHLEFFVEDSPSAGAATWFGDDGQGGFKLEWSFTGKSLRDTSFLPWDMGFFRTRWGLCLGAARKGRSGRALPSRRNTLSGARILHVSIPQGVGPELQERWPFNVPPANLIRTPYNRLPPDEVIEEAHQQGISVIILHQGWMRCGGSNCDPPADYSPRDPADLKRFVKSCHRRNIRVGLYMRGTEQFALFQPYFEKFLKRDFDGIYVDWSSPFAMGHRGCTTVYAPAYSYFLFTRALRERVGEKGFLIAHSGGAPTLLAFANFDAYLPGEARLQKEHLLKSPDEALYHGFASCVGTNPIPRFDLPQAVAFYAGLGFQPHLFWTFGEGVQPRPMAALWRMLSSIPIEDAVCYNDRKENLTVVQSSNKTFVSTVYKVDASLLLLMTANLGEGGKTTLRVDLPALGLAGGYRIQEMRAGRDGGCTTRELGEMTDGTIEPDAFEPYEYRAYRLERTR